MRWWVSFAGPEGNRGLLIAGPADSVTEILKECNRRGVNPGGEVLALPFDEAILIKNPGVAAWTNSIPRYKLFQKEDIPDFAEPMSYKAAKKQGIIPAGKAQFVHDNCNCEESAECSR